MTDDIPDEISVYKLIQSHVVEIASLKKQCKIKQCKQNAQRIPRHMRRRAASNNPKRLPKALQRFAVKNNEEPKRKKTKSPKIGTRNKDPRRTLLHLWFAKRFKLIPKWNSLIPYKNNNKNQRLLYRHGQNGYTVFYLPFVKSLLLDYRNSSKDALLSKLSHLCSKNDLNTLQESKSSHQCIIDLFEYDQMPLNLIAPVECVWIDEQQCFLISAHICSFDSLIQSLSTCFDESIVIQKDVPFSHIQLYGNKANQHLNRAFFQKQNQFFIDQVPIRQFGAIQIDGKDKLTEPQNTQELHNFIQLFNSENAASNSSCKNGNQTIVAFRKYLIDKTETIHLMIENKHLKMIWNRITQNMAHLVGGWRDLEVMSVETRSCLFPSIGYFDLKSNQTNVPGLNVQDKYVIRDQSVVQSLANLSLENITIDHKERVFVYVTIEYIKGIPRQHDLIYIPERTLLERYLEGDKWQEMRDELLQHELKSAVGFVEYGSFCMQAAKCRAVAAMSLQALECMIIEQRSLSLPQNKLFALVKTKFNHVNLVTVSVISRFNLT